MVQARKRTSSGSGHSESSKKKRQDHTVQESSVFISLLSDVGYFLKKNSEPNEIRKDQSVFQRDLEKELKRHPEYPEVIEEFNEGLAKQLDDPVRFRWCLSPSVLPPDEELGTHGGTQDSLLRLLLGIDDLQPAVINMLLEKLAEFTCEEDNIIGGEKVNMPHLIMNQLRWLDRVVKSKELLEKLFEVISITPVEIQREIISALPEVIEDSQHHQVATRLRDVLNESSELAVCVLESLANLNLQTDSLSEVRESVLQTLPSAELCDLPVIIKFLLQTVSGYDEALEVVGEIRKNLDLKSASQLSSNSRTSSSDRSAEALIMDTLKSAIRFQRIVAEAWIKCIEAVKISADHKILDLCVLFVLHSTNYKKPVETLIRNKIRSGLITEGLVQNTIRSSHASILQDYFGSILGLAEVMLRSAEPVLTYMSSYLYKQAFTSFDTFCRQEIVGNLVTHIGSGVSSEVDSSLHILGDLVQDHTVLMVPFTVFIKGVLDYLDNLSVTQIRRLYAMLSTLAFNPDVDESSLQDEMHIIIRKQLSNNNPKYKRMGVIGTIMVVKCLAKVSGRSNMSNDTYRQVINLLQLVTSSTSKCADTSALFMDELSAVIAHGDVDVKVESWINDHVINYFQDDFVVDIEPENENSFSGSFVITPQYGLDGAEDGAIGLNLFHLMVSNKSSTQPQVNSRASPVCLSPTFRLLQICEKRQSEGSLEGIDALLGCPLYLPDKTITDKLQSLSVKEKQQYCEALFLTVNWFREVINAFATQSAPEMKAKVISRLHHITQMNDLIKQAITVLPKFEPPPACFDVEQIGKPCGAVVTTTTKKKTKQSKRKGTKDKENTSDISDDDGDCTPDVSVQVNGKDEDSNDSVTENKTTEKVSVDMTKYRAYFRELDLEVFQILHVKLISRAALDTEMNTKNEEPIQIQAPQLHFLLSDLVMKLEHALPNSAAKRTSFLKVKNNKAVGFSNLEQKTARQVAETAVSLLPALCDHLEQTSAFFQHLIEENDGVLDGPGFFTAEAQVMADCLQLLLKILLAIFSWTGFALQENRTLLKEALTVLSARLSPAGSSQTALQHMVKQSLQYLEKFSASIPNLACAVALTKLSSCIVHKTEDHEALQPKIEQMCGCFMKREWLDAEGEKAKGAKHNELVQDLLKMHFVNSEDVLAVLEKLVTVAIPELVETDKNGCSNTFSILSRHTFAVFYRTMLNELVGCVKTVAPGKRSDTTEMKMEKLIRWSMAVKIFHGLVTLVKVFEARSNLNAVLKCGRVFVETFLKQAMPLVDDLFKTHKDDVTGLLKNLQISTRALHHMCGHSKIIKDVSLTNQVPLVKKCLEMFVYRVKACLTLNNCLEAFWLGNLKNRDLKGEEIVQVSQSSTAADTTTAGDSDDNLPSDDSDEEEVSMDGERGEENHAVQESYSEQF